jgi:putative ABC transport system ATP-binding protein
LRSFLDGAQHDADLDHEEEREDGEKHEEGRLHRAGAEAGDGDVHGQQALDGPGLAAHLGDNPAALPADEHERDAAQAEPEEPVLLLQLVLLKQVGIEPKLWNKFPNQLSGGEAQRVGIVRAIINSPDMVFADEPTGALNSSSSDQVLNVLTDVNNKGQSILMVTHDMKSARRGNRIIYLKDGTISGECELGPYVSGDRARHDKLRSFLTEMGW